MDVPVDQDVPTQTLRRICRKSAMTRRVWANTLSHTAGGPKV